MRLLKAFILILLFCGLLLESVIAQRQPGRHSRPLTKNYNRTKISCPVFETDGYPYHGLGFKLGDPFAITYKFYSNRNFSFGVDFGKAASGLYNRYFRELFPRYVESDTFSTAGASLNYLTHQVKSDFIGEAKMLYHFDGRKVSPGLLVYIGVGWETKNTQLDFGYFYQSGTNGSEEPFLSGRFSVSRFTMGPQLILGVEYANFQSPITAFIELEYYNDTYDDIGWRHLEGGFGLRYIF